MMAYRYANIEKYLHGISFKGGSHMSWRQGLLAGEFTDAAKIPSSCHGFADNVAGTTADMG
jgi:hypothetical protein